jgi:hypothetical protein
MTVPASPSSLALCVLLAALPITAGAARPKRPKPRPDLVERSVSQLPSGTLDFGDDLTVRAQVRNAGHAKAPRSTTQFFLVGRLPPTLAATGWPIGSQAIPALKPGRSYTGTAHLRIPAASSGFDGGGGWHLIACADGPAKVRESNEANDCTLATTEITVKDKPNDPLPAQDGAPGLRGSGTLTFADQSGQVRFSVTFNQSVDTVTFWLPRDVGSGDFDGSNSYGCGGAQGPDGYEEVINGQTYHGIQCSLRTPQPPDTPLTGIINVSPDPSAGMGGYLYGATDNGNSVSGPFTMTGP